MKRAIYPSMTEAPTIPAPKFDPEAELIRTRIRIEDNLRFSLRLRHTVTGETRATVVDCIHNQVSALRKMKENSK